MATTPNLDDYLSSLGFDPDTTYAVPENPADAALMGVNAFVREHSPGDDPASTGVIHITGPSVKGHTAPLKAVLTDSGQEITLSIGTISPADVVALHPGNQVDIEAERRVSRRPGGRRYEKLIGVSLQKRPDFQE